MNTTRMPGFSAEAALYRTSARFQADAMFAGVRQAGEVVPALPFPLFLFGTILLLFHVYLLLLLRPG